MFGKKSIMAATAALAVAAALGSPLGAYADAVAYPATPSEVQSETAKDDTLKEQADANVAAKLNSVGGTWSDGKTTRANGTYVVTIPTQVGYENVPVGKVDLTATYDVNVKGVIGWMKEMKTQVKPTYDKDMNGALQGMDGGLIGGIGPYEKSDGGELNIALTQQKTTWSDAEVSKLAEDGNTVVGTSGTDSLHFTGTVRSASQFVNTIAYHFSTARANIGAALDKLHTITGDNH